jgi:hypothetical protein
MDNKGYVFTPMVYLLFIPIMVIAISYGSIVNEATGATDAGRNAAYNATRLVIDNYTFNRTPVFFSNGTSKRYIENRIISAINAYVINSSKTIEMQTGREVFINNIPINNYTNATFFDSDVNISQTDPFGFYITVRGGIPVKIVQKGQVFEGRTPPISVYVSIEGLDDSYLWVNSKARISNIIYKYPFFTYSSLYGYNYYFADTKNFTTNRLYNLWDCFNGTNNPSNITPRSYYFNDPYGLSFFDKLENRSTSAETNNATRMSSFIRGDPLLEDHGTPAISRVDWEYFKNPPVAGTQITMDGDPITDATGSDFYLSTFYKTFFGLQSAYTS